MTAKMRRSLCVARGLLFLMSWRAVAQTVIASGSEFSVNSYTTGNQAAPCVAMDAGGSFVGVWESFGQDGSSYAVVGQRYSSSGAHNGAEFIVNSYTTGAQAKPVVALTGPGGFVVVWSSYGQDGSQYGVFGQRYGNSGVPMGGEFRVNTFTMGNQYQPSVGSDAAGNFVVVWSSDSQDGSYDGVFGRRFASAGNPLGSEFRVNTYTTYNQFYPSVACNAGGDFVVVWESYGKVGLPPSGLFGVFGQRYSSAGTPLGSEFRVNTLTSSYPRLPKVASDSTGDFTVVWETPSGGSASHVTGQRYASSGSPMGSSFTADADAGSLHSNPSVTVDSSTNFVIIWEGLLADGSQFGVFGQRYASSGAPLGAEFRVNTYTTDQQRSSSVASDLNGDFVVTWQSRGQDGSGYGVFAQRYCAGPLLSVSIGVSGSTTVCQDSTSGTATVTDTGGGTNAHQWGYRTVPSGSVTSIHAAIGPTYLLSGGDFSAPGSYYLVCITTPTCGKTTTSTEVLVNVVADTEAPLVAAPVSQMVAQTLCQ